MASEMSFFKCVPVGARVLKSGKQKGDARNLPNN